MNTDSQWSKQEACFARATQVWLAVSYNTANEFEVRSELHEHVSLAAVNQIKFCVVHEAMNGCKTLKIH